MLLKRLNKSVKNIHRYENGSFFQLSVISFVSLKRLNKFL